MDELEPVYRASADPCDHLLAHRLAAAAGDLLRTLRAEAGDADCADLGGEGDRRSDEFLRSELAAQRPADAVLSEESADDVSRLRASRVWIVDPLDGTREFAEPGRTDWAVHVALWADGALAAGAVALPAQGRVLSTLQPVGLGADPQRRVILVSRSRPPSLVATVADQWRARVLPMGSAGAKTIAVLSGVGSAYIHAGGQFEWDSAAPVAVALAGGLRVRRLDGSPPRYNNPDPALPDLVVCRPSGSDELWSILDAVTENYPRTSN